MDTFVNSLVGIYTTETKLRKYPTEKERKEAMYKTVTSSCYKILCLVIVIISVGLIRWTLQ